MTQTPREKGKAKNWPLQVVYNPSEENRKIRKKRKKKKAMKKNKCYFSVIALFMYSMTTKRSMIPEKATHCFENIPCVKEEKSKSFPDCVGDADGIGDGDCVLLAPTDVTPLVGGVTWPKPWKLQNRNGS